MAYRERVSRAKQFVPFDALKGFREALAQKERIIVPKIELSEEVLEELDRKLHSLQSGQMVSVTYFHNSEYVKVTGIFVKIWESSRTMQVVNTKIPLDDIREILSIEK